MGEIIRPRELVMGWDIDEDNAKLDIFVEYRKGEKYKFKCSLDSYINIRKPTPEEIEAASYTPPAQPKPWDGLKYGDPCWVRNASDKYWMARVFAGVGNSGKPTTINCYGDPSQGDECLPFAANPNKNTEK